MVISGGKREVRSWKTYTTKPIQNRNLEAIYTQRVVWKVTDRLVGGAAENFAGQKMKGFSVEFG